MGDWNNAKCLLCGADAKIHFSDGAPNFRKVKFDQCEGGCPPYTFNEFVFEYIGLFIKESNQKAKIIEFLKAESTSGKYGNEFIPIRLGYLSKILGYSK